VRQLAAACGPSRGLLARPDASTHRMACSEGPRTIGANFGWVLAGNAAVAVSHFGMVTCLARLADPSALGQFALALAICGPPIAFAGLQLRPIIASDVRNSFGLSEYLSLLLVTVSLAYAGVLAYSGLAGRTPAFLGILAALAGTKALDALSDLFYGFFTKKDALQVVGAAMIGKSVAMLCTFAIALACGVGLFLASFGLLVAQLSVVLGYEVPQVLRRAHVAADSKAILSRLRLSHPASYRVRRLRDLLVLSLPLAIVFLVGSLVVNIPRYFIANRLGEHQLGIFAALYNVTQVGSMIVSALSASSIARVAACDADKRTRQFNALLGSLMGLAVLLGLAGVAIALIAGQPLLGLLFGEEYAGWNPLFVWLMVSATALYPLAFLGAGATVRRRMKILAVVQAANLPLLGVLSWWLIGSHGLSGAAWALLVSALFLDLGYACAVWLPDRLVGRWASRTPPRLVPDFQSPTK